MKLHIITIGRPKLPYAKAGWDEYIARLQHYHTVRVTQLGDKFAYNAGKILEAAGSSYKIALVIQGQQFSSKELAGFLEKRELDAGEVCCIVGGPEGLPEAVIEKADYAWSLSQLTLPHDLAMVVALEALYRASTITVGTPYHK